MIIIMGCVDVLLTMLVPEVRRKVHYTELSHKHYCHLCCSKINEAGEGIYFFFPKSWAAIKLKIVSNKEDLNR